MEEIEELICQNLDSWKKKYSRIVMMPSIIGSEQEHRLENYVRKMSNSTLKEFYFSQGIDLKTWIEFCLQQLEDSWMLKLKEQELLLEEYRRSLG